MSEFVHSAGHTTSFLGDSMAILELKVPRESEQVSQTPEAAAQFFANVTNLLHHSFMARILGHHLPSIALEIATINQSIHFYLVCPRHVQSYLESQLKAQYPLISIIPAADYLSDIWTTPGGFDAGQMTLGTYPIYPLKTYKDFSDVDPLVGVLSVVARAKPDEVMVIQYILGAAKKSFRKQGYQYIEETKGDAEHKANTDELSHSQVKQKVSEITVKAGIRLFTHAATKDRARELIHDLSGAYGGFANADGNYLKFSRPSSLKRRNFLLSLPLREHKFVPRNQMFTVTEMASLFHMPNKKFELVPTLTWSRTFATESPENLPTGQSAEKDQINFFGRTDFKGDVITFGIKRNDRRRHVYIVGKSGTGKSTLIANMAINDIRNREGMAIIDPHGDLIENILEFIPSYRVNDVVYLDPASSDRGFVLNPLEVTNQSQKELVVSGLVGIFKKIYGDSWGPRLEYILRNTFFALADIPNATLIDVPEILANKKYRQEKVDRITDPVIRNFFTHEFEGMSDKMQAESISPILNKVGQFISSPIMRNIVGRPNSTIDLEDIMNSGKILLVNLSQGRLGEDNAALLGAMIITKLQLAAMNRVNIAEEERRDFFLYVDEFQNFATESFKKILSEARKYRLDLTLANQYTAQVPEDVLAAIYGNCGTIISFLVGAADASLLTREFDEIYKSTDLTSLSNYQIILKLMIDSQASRPFAATTLPLPRSRTQNREKVIRVSAEKYTKALEMLAKVEQKMEPPQPPIPRQDHRPDYRPEYRPDRKPDFRPDQRNDYRGERRPDQGYQQRSEYRPDRRPDHRPNYQPQRSNNSPSRPQGR